MMTFRDAFLVFTGIVTSVAAAFAQTPAAPAQPPRPAMTLTSSAFPDGDPIPARYTQAGEQVSPELKWTNTPPGTQSSGARSSGPLAPVDLLTC